MKLSELPALVKHDETMFYVPEDLLVVFYSREDAEEHGMNTITRIFKVLEDKETVEETELEPMLENLVNALADRFNAKDLVRQALTNSAPPSLLKADKILREHPEIKTQIKPKRGCFLLTIPDPTPGQRDVEICLRE